MKRDLKRRGAVACDPGRAGSLTCGSHRRRPVNAVGGLQAALLALCLSQVHATGLASVQTEASAASPVAAARAGDWNATRSVSYKRTWGVELIGVKPVASGYMLAFKYRVLDPAKAQALNDRKGKAYLIDEATGTVLAVPAMENIGELRQGAKPVADRSYFMIFGNPGKLVRAGSRVSIVAGLFRVDGLVVE